jgi:hypothetical protein
MLLKFLHIISLITKFPVLKTITAILFIFPHARILGKGHHATLALCICCSHNANIIQKQKKLGKLYQKEHLFGALFFLTIVGALPSFASLLVFFFSLLFFFSCEFSGEIAKCFYKKYTIIFFDPRLRKK